MEETAPCLCLFIWHCWPNHRPALSRDPGRAQSVRFSWLSSQSPVPLFMILAVEFLKGPFLAFYDFIFNMLPVSQITQNHWLYNLPACPCDIKCRMLRNILKVYNDKSEVIVFRHIWPNNQLHRKLSVLTNNATQTARNLDDECCPVVFLSVSARAAFTDLHQYMELDGTRLVVLIAPKHKYGKVTGDFFVSSFRVETIFLPYHQREASIQE